MSNTFPQTEESLSKLYLFIVFYTQLIWILRTIFSAEDQYYENSNIEIDYIWLVAKIENLVKEKEFKEFVFYNDFYNLAPKTVFLKEKVSFIQEMSLKYNIYKPLIPLSNLKVLTDEYVRKNIQNYFYETGGEVWIDHIIDYYNKIFIENNKQSYQLEKEDQRIFIESSWHILEYAEKISNINTQKLEEKIIQLEATQKERSVEPLFQSSFRLIEEFIEDNELKNIVTNDLQQAKLCYREGAYKATVLLCGGMIEAILKEAIASTNNNSPVQREFLAVINRAEQEGIIKQITADLSHVTRIYRNTTHIDTQRSIGLIEESDASIAIKTLKNVCDNVLDWYKKTHSS